MYHETQLTGEIIGSAIEVHRHLGPELLESAYEECLCFELVDRGIYLERQVEVPVNYKGKQLSVGYRIDILVEESVVVELKSVRQIENIHEAQLLTYLKLSNKRLGLLLNFNVSIMKDCIRRFVNG